MSLKDYGYCDFFARSLPSGLDPARVVLASGEAYRVVGHGGEQLARLAGRLKHATASSPELPAIGDWVGLSGSRVEAVLPRRSWLSRKVAGKRTEEQLVAANVDTAIVVTGLDGDFNPRRLERYLTTVWQSGAAPIVLLNKADVAPSLEDQRREVEDLAMGVPVLVSSCLGGIGVDEIRARLRPRETTVLVGSSGVGKSTLINRLLGGEVQRIREVRASDDRGRHTTTHRELFVLPGGALLIDNPGLREIQLWADEGALERSFDDVVALAERCRFNDCTHGDEPGCTVTGAVAAGELAPARLESYRSLQRELSYLHRRQDQSAQRIEKQKWKAIHREMRRSGQHRRT